MKLFKCIFFFVFNNVVYKAQPRRQLIYIGSNHVVVSASQ
jgi:hypothetical protein